MGVRERLLTDTGGSRASPNAFLQTTAAAAAPVVRRRLQRSSERLGLCLVYHRIGDPQGDPARELVPALGSARFASQLAHLRRRYRVVAASELLTAIGARKPGEPFPVAVTFDDDLESHAQVALPILQRSGVPATFFVCGASLERPYSFWWERLQRAVDRGTLEAGDLDDLGLPPATGSIHDLAAAIQALPPARRDEVSARMAPAAGSDPTDSGLRAAPLRALADAGCSIGFHTLRHYDLARLDPETLAAALREGRDGIERVIGRGLELIAYPHGSANAAVTEGAASAGYAAGFVVGEAATAADTDPFSLPRIEPSYGTTAQFALKLVLRLRRAARAADARGES